MAKKGIELKEIPQAFAKIPTAHKAVALVLLLAVSGAVYYFVFYSDLQQNRSNIEKRIAKLKSDLVKLDEYQRDERTQEKEKGRKEELLKRLEAELPKDTNPVEFQEDVLRRAKLASVTVQNWTQGEPVVEGQFKAVPFTLQINGTFAQLGQFFNHMSRMTRLVRLSNVKLGVAEKRADHHLLTANVIASAFQALTDADRAKAVEASRPAAATPAASPKGKKGADKGKGKKKKVSDD